MNTSIRCKRCTFWDIESVERKDLGAGLLFAECRVNPPCINRDEDEEALAEWPLTHENDWCGKYEKDLERTGE